MPLSICMSSEMADRITGRVEAIVPDAEIVRLNPDGSYEGDPSRCNVLCFSVDMASGEAILTESLTRLAADGLEWVQSPGAGYELKIWTDVLDRGVRLTNASGLHAEPIAQYIFTYILHWNRQVRLHQEMQASQTWDVVVSDDLTTKTLGIVGYGGIGSATARVAKAFGMRVVALRRSPIEDSNVDVALGTADLHELLAQSDFVVLSLPLNDETRHTIGPAELSAMKDDAVLINVARGGVVNEPALIRALTDRWIRGAVLDVVEHEPLPVESDLWGLHNCIITPHDAGYSPLAGERLAELFLKNLDRFVAGDRLTNEILNNT